MSSQEADTIPNGSTETGRVRWGVLGVAKIAAGAFIPAVAGSANSEVVAIASRMQEKADAAASEFQIPRSYVSYEDLLDDPDIDAIYNPLPNHLHEEWSVRALEAGKHVLCEKPLAMDAAGARRMESASRKTGRLLMEAFMYRFHPQWDLVRDLIAGGRVGSVRAVHTWFHYPPNPRTNVRYVPGYGGGGLLDVGCYCVDSSRLVFGEEPISARGALRLDDEAGVDVLAAGVLEFPSGIATFTCGIEQDGDQQVHITGTDGHISVTRPFNPWPHKPVRIVLSRPDEIESFEVPVTDQFMLEVEAFAAAIVAGASTPPVPVANAIANMAVLDALRS